MPLTPKGYCDFRRLLRSFLPRLQAAEMPLTPKGYCDFREVVADVVFAVIHGRNAPNAERLL